jgi:hypothetical protein
VELDRPAKSGYSHTRHRPPPCGHKRHTMVPWAPWGGAGAMTRIFRRIHWAALGANVGSAVLFTLLLSTPFLVGAHYRLWLLGLAIGIILGLYFYLRRERYSEPGPDADETRFPR